MRVLIACEFSGIVRDAFLARGHDAWSVDLLPTEADPRRHLIADVNMVINYPERILGGMPRWMRAGEWDLMIAHPPCTYLANSGARWLYGGRGTTVDPDRWAKMENAAALFAECLSAPIPRIAVENPIMHRYGKEAIAARLTGDANVPYLIQTIQPYEYGTPETKATQLWLKNLPPLVPTNIVDGRTPRVHYASPGPNRWMERSRTDLNVAAALADQWGSL